MKSRAKVKVRTLATPRHELRTYIAIGIMLALVASLILATNVPVFAQAEEGTLTDLGEGDGRVLTSQLTTLTPGQQVTYQFEYDGNEQPIAITMNSIPAEAVVFEIWTDERLEQFSEDPDTEPLGRGTAMQAGSGFTNWQGGSPEDETYYVVVTAVGESAASFVLNITSPALAEDQPGAVAVAPTQPADPNVAVVTTDALNVRTGPSTAFPVLLTVPNGTQLTVLGRNAINTWINVELEDGTVGWVTRSLTNYTTVNPNVVATPGTIGTATGATVTDTTTTTATANVTATVPVTPTVALTATAMGGSWQTLAADETAWYSFQYRGGDLPLTVWMDLEPFAAAEFIVVNAVTAQAMQSGEAAVPTNIIGRGRANPVEPGYLYWQADFAEADTYYVLVQPTDDAEGDVLYSINALGPGVGRIVEPAAETAE